MKLLRRSVVIFQNARGLCCFLNYEAANRSGRREDYTRNSTSRAIQDVKFVVLYFEKGGKGGAKNEKT
jgi:hypothetical protein